MNTHSIPCTALDASDGMLTDCGLPSVWFFLCVANQRVAGRCDEHQHHVPWPCRRLTEAEASVFEIMQL